jgi:ATP-dependent Clp protease ATP-binding subunit ClpB
LAEKEIELEVTERAISAIALEGYDPTYGARPLKRVIQQRLQNPLAVELLKHESVAGTRVRIDYLDGEFTFDHVEAASGVR